MPGLPAPGAAELSLPTPDGPGPAGPVRFGDPPSGDRAVTAAPDELQGPDVATLSPLDRELVEVARSLLLRRYRPLWHMIAAALRGRDGRIWTGLHLGATVGRMQVCAEVTALGRAILEGDGTIECAVALRHPKAEEPSRAITIVPPCGACREMITDYDPDAMVIVPGSDGPRRVPIAALLPLPYQR